MKRFLISATLAWVFAGMLVTGCGRADTDGAQCGVEVTQFPVREVIMTADRSFRAVSAEDTVYLDQYVSLLWPEALGDADMRVLQDSLLWYCFGDTVSKDARQAVERFVCDTGVLGVGEGDDGYAVEPVDSLPADIGGMGCYFNNVIASVADLNEEMVTYKVTSAVYTGGAHPMTGVFPFTYDLAEGRVLTVDDILTPEGREAIVPVIVRALARQSDVPVEGLRRAGFFVSQLDYPGDPYICNNVLYFHYNPYEIAPYSSGMIDVAVYPYEIEAYLRPEVKRLFDRGH